MKTNPQTGPPGDTEGSALATATERSARPSGRSPGDAGSSSPPESFRDRFCTAHRCAHSEFADRVLLLTLYFHALPVAVLFWPWRKRLFAADHALIEKLGGARWGGNVQWKLDRLITPAWRAGLGRGRLRCRISSRRLGALMVKVMGSSMETPPATVTGADPLWNQEGASP